MEPTDLYLSWYDKRKIRFYSWDCSFIDLQEALRKFFDEQMQIVADDWTESVVSPYIKGEQEIQPVLDQWFKLVEVQIF